jgi:NAD(P)-dependent dehydrogenase (short-subunit alcohol dehydrogenase family)
MAERSKIALITGAGSGIGRQLVLALTQRAWKVAGIDRSAESLQELEAALAPTRRDFAWSATDVTDARPLQAAAAKLEARLGPFDLLITCAGVAGETPATEMDAAAIARIISVNLIGVSNTIAAVLPGMLTRRRGHIVAISSLAALRALPGQMGYCASKAGLNALMQSLRHDVRPFGVCVTTVCPGHTRTPQATRMYKDEYLWSVEATTREILKAIDRRKRFHAFPWLIVRQLRWLPVLPEWLQAWLLQRRLAQIKK